ncbi:hypothetical protein [Methanobrevibacter sp.]|uniref:hypothetical protein n=1 Tax=Methanobrevibacter sp. TaxID=66852 RepID=UPI00386B3E24
MVKKEVKEKFSDTDKKLKLFIINKDELSESRIRFYNLIFDELYKLNKGTPSEIIDKCLEDQKLYLENGLPVKKEMSDRFVSELQTDYYEHLKKQKNSKGKPLSKRTIQTKISSLRHFLDKYDVELPDAPEIKIKKTRVRDNEIPTWDDVDLAIKYAKSPRDKTIIGFAATTGFRVSDIANIKISHLIRACSIYFDENEEHTLENLLEKDPENICPCWDMDPQKTIWHGNLAITFNTPEVSVLLWQYLKYRIELNDRNKRGRIIDVDEPLFQSQAGGHLDPLTISIKCSEINQMMGGELDRNGVFGKFRIHNLRSLFKTTCKRNLYKVNVDSDIPFDGDVVNLFLGHSSDNAHADVYEAVPEDSTDSYVRKVYEGLIPYLSISRPSEVRSYSTKEYLEVEEYKKEVEERFKTQEINYQRDMDNKDKEIENLKQQLANKDQQYKEGLAQLKTSVDSQMEDIREEMNQNLQVLEAYKTIQKGRESMSFNFEIDFAIKKYYQRHNDLDFNDLDAVMKKRALCKLAYDEAIKDEDNFKNTDEYIATLFEIVNIHCKRKPNLINDTIEEMQNKNDDSIDLIINEIMNMFINQPGLLELTKCDAINLRTVVQNYVFKNPELEHKANKLTPDERENIIDDILAECVKFNAQNN